MHTRDGQATELWVHNWNQAAIDHPVRAVIRWMILVDGVSQLVLRTQAHGSLWARQPSAISGSAAVGAKNPPTVITLAC